MHLRTSLLAGMLALASPVLADPSAAQWQWRVEPGAVQPGDEAEIVFSATIPAGLILYSSDFSAELGPRPARFEFDDNDAIELRGPIAAVQSQRRKDKVFGTEYTYFAERAEFRQKVLVLQDGTQITGLIVGQTCQEKDGFCELFKQPFSIPLE